MTITDEKKLRSKARKALWIAIVTIIAWLAIGGFSGQAFSKISNVQENDNSAFLPNSAESTAASKITIKFQDQSANLLPTLLIFVGELSPSNKSEKIPPGPVTCESIPGTDDFISSLMNSTIKGSAGSSPIFSPAMSAFN